jgi:hypothetical protein
MRIMSNFQKFLREQLWLDTRYWQHVWLFLKAFAIFAMVILAISFLPGMLGKSEL